VFESAESQCLSSANGLEDDLRRRSGCLVLPEPQDQPSSLGEPAVGIGVTLTIGLELRRPPRAVGSRVSLMDGAGMPEAAIDVDGDPLSGKHHICAAPHTRNRGQVDSVAQSSSMQCGSQRELRSRVTLSRALHAQPRRLGRSGRNPPTIPTGTR